MIATASRDRSACTPRPVSSWPWSTTRTAVAARIGAGVDADSERLFTQVTGGDRDALEPLLQRYLPQLHAYVRVRLRGALGAREASADVVQSVCRQVLAARESFTFRGEERFRAWLFTAALNKLREKHRLHHGQKRDLARERPADGGEPSAAAWLVTPSQEAVGRETAAAIENALAELDEDHREVVTLARIVRLPHRVIAEVMDRSEEATRKLLARALLALAERLEARGVDVEAWHAP
jgi:RNA polymerase sigma-70 factor (subfamily 1)